MGAGPAQLAGERAHLPVRDLGVAAAHVDEGVQAHPPDPGGDPGDEPLRAEVVQPAPAEARQHVGERHRFAVVARPALHPGEHAQMVQRDVHRAVAALREAGEHAVAPVGHRGVAPVDRVHHVEHVVLEAPGVRVRPLGVAAERVHVAVRHDEQQRRQPVRAGQQVVVDAHRPDGEVGRGVRGRRVQQVQDAIAMSTGHGAAVTGRQIDVVAPPLVQRRRVEAHLLEHPGGHAGRRDRPREAAVERVVAQVRGHADPAERQPARGHQRHRGAPAARTGEAGGSHLRRGSRAGRRIG